MSPRPALDLGSFTTDLTRWQEQVREKSDLLVQGFTQTLFNEVQSGGKYSPGTPIDQGYARANWDGGIGAIPSQPAADSPEAARQRTESAILGGKAGDVLYLSNTAAYITKLEFGHSGQAPQGFVRLALNAAQEIADEVGAFLAGGQHGPQA